MARSSRVPPVHLSIINPESGPPPRVQCRRVTSAQFSITTPALPVASSLGSLYHPDWYYNLKANPQVQLSVAGQSSSYYARIASKAEREQYWQLALEYYPGYQAYEGRTNGREIPIVVLEPVA